MNSGDFLSIFVESNSIKNENNGEIIITTPLLEVEGQYKITTPCSITSNCNTLIKCELIEIFSDSVSFSNFSMEGCIITINANKFSLDNFTIRSTKKCADSNIVINSSEDVLITNSRILDSQLCGLTINSDSKVKIDKTEIGNFQETILVINRDCNVILTNSHIHHSKNNGIYTNGPNTIEITDCIISDTQYPLVYLNNTEILVKNTKFQNCEQSGFSAHSSPLVQIESNTFENIKDSSISIFDDSLGFIKGNTFSKIGGNAVYTKLSEIEIFDNIVCGQDYPAFAITHDSSSEIYNNKISNISLNGIALRNARYVKITNNEIDSIGECGISISNTEEALIENNKITNCQITAIESYNHSKALVKNNIISNLGQNAFLCYTAGFIKADSNVIENVKNSMAKLAFKGNGEFVNNKIKNCPNQCECLTSSLYFFNKNGDFKGLTNDIEKVDDSIVFNDEKLNNSNVLCLKCNKKPRNCFIFECCHKVFCKECADLAFKNHEKCILCRFPIEKVSEGYGMNNENLCIICYTNEPDSIIIPCGHSGVCSSCLDSWFKENNVCPICRCESKNYRKIENDI